jgi:hypothetical protein
MTVQRKEQKRRSRVKNNVTTMQLSNALKKRIKRIQKLNGFDKQDEALDEILSFYEDAYPNILLMELDND